MITNTNNIITQNVAVAGVGTGFWFQPSVKPTGRKKDIFYGAKCFFAESWGRIRGNSAHSVVQGLSTCSVNGYEGSNMSANLDGLRVYGAQLGIYKVSSNITNQLQEFGCVVHLLLYLIPSLPKIQLG